MRGIGGKWTSLFVGGVLGINELTLVNEDMPRIMSVGTLDELEKVLDMSANSAVLTKVHFKLFLDGSPSGHRLVSVAVSSEYSDVVEAPRCDSRRILAPDLESNITLWIRISSTNRSAEGSVITTLV